MYIHAYTQTTLLITFGSLRTVPFPYGYLAKCCLFSYSSRLDEKKQAVKPANRPHKRNMGINKRHNSYPDTLACHAPENQKGILCSQGRY